MKKFPLLLILFFPLVVNARLQGKARVDSLLKVLPEAAEDTSKVKLLNTLSFALSDIDPDAGYKYAAQGLQLADKLKWKRGIAGANHSLATVCYSRSEFDRVIKYATISGQLYDELNDKRSVAINLGTAATAWYGKSDLTKALELFLAQQKIVESIGEEALLATCCLNQGNIHYELKNYPKALSCFFIALKKSERIDDKRNIATCLHNIGGLYSVLGDNKRALEYLERALRLGEMLGDEYSIGHYRASIGSAYVALGRYAEALENGSKALEISTGIGDKETVANSLLLLGSTFLKITKDTSGKLTPGISINKKLNLNKAVGYLEKSAAEAKEADILTMLVEIYEKLSEAYKLSGRTADAYDSYVVYSKLKDSVYSNDNRLKIAGLETRRETELKEKQIEINKTQAKQKQNQQLLFTLGIISLLVTVFMVARSYRKQKRSNMQLEVANKSLAEEKQKSDKLAAELNESLVQKEGLAKQLELSAAMKSKFFANISHELRTPVTLLTGMLELVQDTPETNGHGEKLKMAYSNSRKLQTMVDEILDLSKLESGTSRLNIRSRAIAPLLKRTVYAFETLIEKQQLILAYSAHDMDGVHIAMDEDKFEKIINNLIYNAVKFNIKGGWIKINAETSADGHSAVVRINNSGAAISNHDLPHIFERFYQGGTSAAKAGGAGIGLSLVKEFTQLMNGTVQVSGNPETGTTFTLQFPVVQKGEEEAPVDEELFEAPSEDWERLHGKQLVLLVEDNVEMRYYLKEVLGNNVTLAEAGNGKEALQWLESNSPDLIISDIMMPQMDGREFINRLKGEDALKKIPIISLSALADKENQVSMLRLGIDDYLVKPFSATELRVRVFNLLNNMQERRQFALQPSEPGDISLEGTEADEFRNKIKEFVLSKIKNINVSVFDLAYELAMSERQLYRTAKSLTGCTPAQLIKEIRLQKSYELLLSGDIQKIDDVARRVGFDTSAYFSRQFFERFGKRPTEFL